METTVREQRSLIMDRSTLTERKITAHGVSLPNGYHASFYPITKDNNTWLEKLSEWLSKPGDKLVEISSQARAREHVMFTHENDVAAVIISIKPNRIRNKLCFDIEFKPTGPKGAIIENLITNDEPVIFSAKALVNIDTPDLDNEILLSITGLQCYPNELLKIPVSAKQLRELGYIVPDVIDGVKNQKINPPLVKEFLNDVRRVLVVNAAAGNIAPSPEEFENQVMRQTRIDMLECLELLDAVIKGDASELRDGLADKRITLNGFSTILPISLSDDFNTACANQFTRFDPDYESALATKTKYADLGVPTAIEQNIVHGDGAITRAYFVNKVIDDVTGLNGEFYPKGKFVKSVNYEKDNFKDGGIVFDTSISAAFARWDKIRSVLFKFVKDTDNYFQNLGE